MKKSIIRQFPSDWGQDGLTKFSDYAINNIVGSVTTQPLYPVLECVEQNFLYASDKLQHQRTGIGLLGGLFFHRSHSAFRGACLLAMAGQCVEATPVLRLCLETAMYSLHIEKNPNVAETWIKRSQDDFDSVEKSRDKFKYGVCKKTLKTTSPDLFSVADKLYNQLIVFGAHPNSEAFCSSLTTKSENKTISYNTQHLNAGTLAHSHILKMSIEIGICSIEIFSHVFPLRFNLIQMLQRIDSMKEFYAKQVKTVAQQHGLKIKTFKA